VDDQAVGVRERAGHVLVLGAGIVGTTTALELRRRGAAVTLVADTFGRSTAGVLVPPAWDWPRPVDPDDRHQEVDARAERWAARTYRCLEELVGVGAGVRWCRTHVHLDRASERDPAETRRRCRLHAAVTDVVAYQTWPPTSRYRPRLTAGYHFAGPVVDPARYVTWATARLVEDGARIRRRHVPDLAALHSLAREHRADAVVACAGAGAGAFTDDPQLTTRLAVQVVLPADRPPPERRCAVLREDGGTTVLSATPLGDRQVLAASSGAGPIDPLALRDRCVAVLDLAQHLRSGPPAIRAGTVSHRTGGARVELVGDHVPVVHHYGHGGQSLGVVWGAAATAAALALGAAGITGADPAAATAAPGEPVGHGRPVRDGAVAEWWP
jgi:D-amino-acid oxidase